MKKILYLLLVLPFAMMISSCSSDNDLPNVNVTMTFDNAAVDGNTLYVLQDSVFSLTGISTQTVGSDKSSTIANIKYFWNGFPAPSLTWSPLPMEINMANMPVSESGKCQLGLDATLLEVDKSIAYCTLIVPIQAVASVDDLPNGVTLGTATYTFTSSQSSK